MCALHSATSASRVAIVFEPRTYSPVCPFMPGGVEALDPGISPYNGLAILCLEVAQHNLSHLQSFSVKEDQCEMMSFVSFGPT